MNEEQEVLMKHQFHEEMLRNFKRTAKEVKYKPTRRLDLMNKYGGYEAAIKILPTDSNTFDFTLLWEAERLDLSVEALIAKDRYKDIFPHELVAFCKKRLEEYNYAPRKLEVETDHLDDFLENLFSKEEPVASEVVTEDQFEDHGSESISTTQWHDMLMNSAIFTSVNCDLIFKIFSLGQTTIDLEHLSQLEGYTSVYPFYDVLIALCKRIKSHLKLDIPRDEHEKPIWWSFLFKGQAKDKKQFEWYLRDEVREAIRLLMEEGVIPPLEEKYFKTQELSAPQEMEAIEEAVEVVTPKPMEAVEVATPKPMEAVEVATPKPMEAVEVVIPKPMEAVEVATPKPMEAIEVATTKETEDLPSSNDATDTLWQHLKAACIDYYGPVCECCGFDFGYTYGDAFDQFIPIYCTDATKKETPEKLNPIEDMVPLCCNCEAVITHRAPHYTIEEVKTMLKNNQK